MSPVSSSRTLKNKLMFKFSRVFIKLADFFCPKCLTFEIRITYYSELDFEFFMGKKLAEAIDLEDEYMEKPEA